MQQNIDKLLYTSKERKFVGILHDNVEFTCILPEMKHYKIINAFFMKNISQIIVKYVGLKLKFQIIVNFDKNIYSNYYQAHIEYTDFVECLKNQNILDYLKSTCNCKKGRVYKARAICKLHQFTNQEVHELFTRFILFYL